MGNAVNGKIEEVVADKIAMIIAAIEERKINAQGMIYLYNSLKNKGFAVVIVP